jgi:mannosyltransferase OCH1-like enzyme
MNIPNKIWHVWIGPYPQPKSWMNTWVEKHKDWEYCIIDNNFLSTKKFKNQHLIDEYFRREKFSGVADLIRYEILFEHGGFMPPADAVCLENTNDLWIQEHKFCYTVYENETIRPGYVSPIYAANQGNEFLRLIIDTLNKLSPSELDDDVWKSTGNYFLMNMISQHKPNIKIFPSYYFIPNHFKQQGRGYTGPEKIYADQMWGTTKKRYTNS